MPTVLAIASLAALAVPTDASAQWTNRYEKVRGYGHHVYLEGYELPVLTVGPFDPAPSPKDPTIAFASRGWIWLFDPATGTARRITNGGDMDSRPAWSPDGRAIAFVRDDTRNTWIVVRDLDSGVETIVADTPALELDPSFSPDGAALYYSSAEAGDIDLWRVDLATGAKEKLTQHPGLELKPQPHPNGKNLVYLSKRPDEIRVRDLTTQNEEVLLSGNILSMARPALSATGTRLAVNWPTETGWELRLHNVAAPQVPVVLTRGAGLPLTPAFAANGNGVYFSEANSRQQMELKYVSVNGGPVATIPVRDWDWGAATARLRITTAGDDGDLTAARIAVLDGMGHPAVPDETAAHFDGQNGRVFFYSPGVLEVQIPAGAYSVSAVHGLTTPEVTVTGVAEAGSTVQVDVTLESVWDARAAGWTSADHHFHLNYGGQYRLPPEALILPMRGENLDLGTPLIANLHNRFEGQNLFGWQKTGSPPLVWIGQEVRSHFLGHVGLVGTRDLFWPWIWGPGYEIHGSDDRPNTEPLEFARKQGGVSSYVHPVPIANPFDGNEARLPVEMTVDAVLGDVATFELVCLWSNEMGSSDFWYRVLNVGVPLGLSAGTDIMLNLYRTMAVGTMRVYTQTGDAVNWPAHFEALKAGQSFVTNGPMLEFTVNGTLPGEATRSGNATWSIDVHSAAPFSRVEILVNGEPVWSEAGLAEPGSRHFEGQLELPAGGWVAARALGGETMWPGMAPNPYAHTAPVWIGEIGSIEPNAARAAATDLLRALDAAEQRLRRGYGAAPTPNIEDRFRKAREKLEAMR